MNELQKELEDLEKELDKTINASTEKLGKKSLDYMVKQYQTNKKDGKKGMAGHIGNLNLKPYKKSYISGFVVSSGNDEIAVYNEFGTGIVGYQNPNPLAQDAGYKYNLESPYKGVPPKGAIEEYGREFVESVTTPNTWWYHKNNKWWYTEGMEGKQMFSSLVDELRKNAVKDFKVSIGQTIGNYRSYGGK